MGSRSVHKIMKKILRLLVFVIPVLLMGSLFEDAWAPRSHSFSGLTYNLANIN